MAFSNPDEADLARMMADLGMDTFTKVIEEPDKGDVIHAPHAEDDLRKGKSAVDVDSPRAAWNAFPEFDPHRNEEARSQNPMNSGQTHRLNRLAFTGSAFVIPIKSNGPAAPAPAARFTVPPRALPTIKTVKGGKGKLNPPAPGRTRRPVTTVIENGERKTVAVIPKTSSPARHKRAVPSLAGASIENKKKRVQSAFPGGRGPQANDVAGGLASDSSAFMMAAAQSLGSALYKSSSVPSKNVAGPGLGASRYAPAPVKTITTIEAPPSVAVTSATPMASAAKPTTTVMNPTATATGLSSSRHAPILSPPPSPVPQIPPTPVLAKATLAPIPSPLISPLPLAIDSTPATPIIGSPLIDLFDGQAPSGGGPSKGHDDGIAVATMSEVAKAVLTAVESLEEEVHNGLHSIEYLAAVSLANALYCYYA